MELVKQLRKLSYVGSVKYVAEAKKARTSETILPAYIELRLKTPPPVARIALASNARKWEIAEYRDRIYVNRGRQYGIMHDFDKEGKPFFIDTSELRTRADEAKILDFFRALRPQHLSLV